MNMFSKDMITPDLILSFWIFIWFIIYYICICFNIFPDIIKIFNPLLALCIAFFFNFLQFTYLITNSIKNKKNIKPSLRFLIVLLIFKGVPIFLLKNQKINVKNNLLTFVIIIIIYNIYLFIRGTNIYKIYEELNKSLINGQSRSVFISIISKII